MYQGKEESSADMQAINERAYDYAENSIRGASPIHEATDTLDQAIAQLEKTVTVLQERLSPVTLEKNMKEVSDATEAAPSGSPHRERLLFLSYQIHTVRRRLESSMRDLEV